MLIFILRKYLKFKANDGEFMIALILQLLEVFTIVFYYEKIELINFLITDFLAMVIYLFIWIILSLLMGYRIDRLIKFRILLSVGFKWELLHLGLLEYLQGKDVMEEQPTEKNWKEKRFVETSIIRAALIKIINK